MPFQTNKKKIRNLSDGIDLSFYQPKRVLAKYGYTQIRLAEELGVSPASINGVVSGNPSIAQVKLLADTIGCSFFEFFDFQIDKKKQELLECFMNTQSNKPTEQLGELTKMIASLRGDILLFIGETQKVLRTIENKSEQGK